MQPSRIWLGLAGLNGFMAVAVGAFAAHGVKSPGLQALLHTGAEYQGLYAVSALACFNLAGTYALTRPARWAGLLFGAGGLIFGCSLYILAVTGVKQWGAVTPVGGLLLLAGWVAVAWGALAGEAAQEA